MVTLKKKTAKADTESLIIELTDKYKWAGKKHSSAIMILIQRICDIEEARRPFTCIENKAVDELVSELLVSLKCLLINSEK